MKKNTPMTLHVEEFIRYRRQLGYQCNREAPCLRSLAAFMDKEARGRPLTDDLALRWSTIRSRRPDLRMASLKKFIAWFTLRDPRHKVSEKLMVVRRRSRTRPYIFDPDETAAMMDAARKQATKDSNERVYAEIIGLLACTGLRPGEPLRLDDADIDQEKGELLVRDSKNLPLRLVPLQQCVLERMQEYKSARQRIHPPAITSAFFLDVFGKRVNKQILKMRFDRIRDEAGVPFREHWRKPHLYDFRHTFACRHLLHHYRAGKRLECAIADLSVYMGHRNIGSTYWYMTNVPELAELCVERIRENFGFENQGGRR